MLPKPDRSCRRTDRLHGLSLVEVMIASVVMAVALLGLSRSMISSVRVTASNRETSVALEAAQQAIEHLQAKTFSEIFSLYNADSEDDPDGEIGDGPTFAVEGLTAPDDDADGVPGEIIFPVASNGSGELRENAVNFALGMPRDLDADGKIDTANHSDDYALLPVLVRVAWRTATGASRSIEVMTVLSER